MAKPFWQSRTFWFNLLAFLAALAIYVLEGMQVGRFAEWVQLDDDLIAMLLTLANLGLRTVTRVPLSFR